jgi:ribonuclease-3
MDELKRLEQQFDVRFNDYSLLSRALTHRSFLNENPEQSLDDNERLEFLGDAVLDFIVGAYLYHRFPEMNEGELTMLRAALVRTETLAGFARDLSLGESLLLGYGEAESGGRFRPAILCGAFEAVIGAIFLDQGLTAVEMLVHRLIDPALEEILATATHRDAKSEFQIWAQGRFNVTPRYEVVTSEGPDHAKVFTVAVLLGNEIWGEGDGRSKQLAAQAAATQALEKAETVPDEEERETAGDTEDILTSL